MANDKSTSTQTQPICQLCKTWAILDGRKTSEKKFCTEVQEFREADDPVCDCFEIREMFRCKKGGQWRSTGLCVKKQDTRIGEESFLYERICRKCKQGKQVKNAWKKSKVLRFKRRRKRSK